MKRWAVLLFSLFSLVAKAQDNDIKFEAILSKAKLGQNERLRVSFEMNKDGDFFEAPSFENFEVLMGPSQSISSSFINGKRSFSKSYTYVLRPKKQGQLIIDSASITIDNTVYTTDPKTVLVTEPIDNPNAPKTAQDIADESLYLVATLSNDRPYLNQGVLVTYTLYFSPRVYINNFIPVENPTYKNFWSQDLPIKEYETRRTTFKNESFNAVDLKTVVLYPQKSGSLALDPFALELYVQIPTGRRDFFGDPIMRSATKTVKAGDLSINVRELPEEGKPSDFSGAVGDFELSVDASRTSLEANESTQIKVKISGKGNLKLLSIPELSLPSALEKYDPEYTDNVRVNREGMNGSVTDSYTVVPRYAGSYPVDPVAFTYFDPNTKSYKTLNSDLFDLTVEGSTLLPNTSASTPIVEKNTPVTSGFKSNAYQTSLVTMISSPWFESNAYYLILALLLILGFTINSIIKTLKTRLGSSAQGTKKALPKKIKTLLKRADKLTREQNPEFYSIASEILFLCLEKYSGVDLSTASRQEREEKLQTLGADKGLIERINTINDRILMVRYSGSASARIEEDLKILHNIIDDLL
ncbi:MAG: BatD family protein [Flavobacteriaceae bacterium]|nr:BatD family protein [Flavobacteriaceae bacterium]